ncbi:MAG: two-component sensor histidine kinase [Chitinophagaceae bacterium]|nr:MAG: two-component sensor histidine kinase [Chitinophagaceae bacterium]
MADPTKKKLRRATGIYWLLLTYIVVALIWWFISLERQNDSMRNFKEIQLQASIGPYTQSSAYEAAGAQILDEYRRNRLKYALEGSVFLILILIGATFVYRSVRRQFRLQQQQQNFMMAVTHELKTPIAVARLNLETLQKHNLEPDKQKKLIRMTLEETARLTFLTNNILVASQLEGGGYSFNREEIDLSDLLRDSINDFRKRFPDRVFTDQIEIDADLKADPLLIQMLINNLLENAIKYSPKETVIAASLARSSKQLRLEIRDNGAGIPDDEKEKIFDKFYRVGNESTRKTQGTGLGLYLCRKIADDHNADILVTNNTPHGSTFAVIFYL